MVSETYPLPPATAGDRRPLIALIERVFNLGGVMRLVLEYGKPLKVSRLVDKSEMPDAPEDLIDGDIYNAARNNEMQDLTYKASFGKPVEKMSAYEALFHAFDVISNRHLKPRAFLIHTPQELNVWLMADAHREVSEIFGVEVRSYKEIPDQTALLVAAAWDDPDSIVFSLRLEMTTTKGKKA
jgi:hypothetical protein